MMRLTLLLAIIISLFQTSLAGEKPYQFKDVGLSIEIKKTFDKPYVLTDEFDKDVNLNEIVKDKPTIINFVYLNCPLLCHLMLDGLANVLDETDYKINTDFQIITISIDPKETNKNLIAYRKKYFEQLDITKGWHFLKGSEKQIKELTDFFGYQYKYIPRTKDYAHPSVIIFYNNSITNYVEGVTYDKKSFDYALITTKSKKTLKEKIVTYCYYFDPATQTYSLLIFKILRVFCLLTVLILFIMIAYFIYKERKQKNGTN